MKKRILTLIAVLLFITNGFTQTKLIFHRSHSGSDISFSMEGPDNLGYFPEEFTKEKIEKMNEEQAKEEKRLLEEEKKREHEQKVIEEARKKEAARLAESEKQKQIELDKQKQAEAEKQKLIQAEKNKTYAKDSAVKVNSAKVIKDTTAKTHKRQYYSPYGLPTKKLPQPEAGIQFIRNRFTSDSSNSPIEANLSVAAWLLISAAAISCFLVRK